MRPMRYAAAPTRATGAIVAAGFGVSVAVNWPGHLSYDSVVQLYEGRSAQYGGWHPPVMSWLLGVGDRIVTGTGLFVLFDVSLLYLALMGLLLLHRRSSWIAAGVALVLVATPQFLLYPGIVWKDVLFAAASCLGFVSLAYLAVHWNDRWARLALFVSATLLLALASLARQNGFVTLPVAAWVIGWIAYRAERRRLRSIGFAALWFAAALAVFIGSMLALNSRWTGVSGPTGQMRLLATYDLAGALASDPRLPLERLDEEDPRLARLMREQAARLYTPERNDTLVSSAELQSALNRADERAIPAQWADFIARNPLLYLKLRWAAFRWVFFTPDLLACRPVFVGISGPPELMRNLGIAPRMDARDNWLFRYALSFSGTPIWSHATFAIVGLVALVLLLRRRRQEDIAIAGLLASSFAFAASFFVISIACDYRYLYFLDVAALLSALYLTLDAPQWLGTTDSARRSDD